MLPVSANACPLPRASRALETAELALLVATLAAVPLFFHGSQLATGTVVNACLALGALHVRDARHLAALVLVPAVAAIAGVGLFGAVTAGLLALVPMIWLSNLVYLLAIRRGTARWGYAPALALAAPLKGAVLFASVAGLVAAGLLPAIMLTTMVPVALLAAMLGGVVARGVDRGTARWMEAR